MTDAASTGTAICQKAFAGSVTGECAGFMRDIGPAFQLSVTMAGWTKASRAGKHDHRSCSESLAAQASAGVTTGFTVEPAAA